MNISIKDVDKAISAVYTAEIDSKIAHENAQSSIMSFDESPYNEIKELLLRLWQEIDSQTD